jgi:hypothetical protein
MGSCHWWWNLLGYAGHVAVAAGYVSVCSRACRCVQGLVMADLLALAYVMILKVVQVIRPVSQLARVQLLCCAGRCTDMMGRWQCHCMLAAELTHSLLPNSPSPIPPRGQGWAPHQEPTELQRQLPFCAHSLTSWCIYVQENAALLHAACSKSRMYIVCCVYHSLSIGVGF